MGRVGRGDDFTIAADFGATPTAALQQDKFQGMSDKIVGESQTPLVLGCVNLHQTLR